MKQIFYISYILFNIMNKNLLIFGIFFLCLNFVFSNPLECSIKDKNSLTSDDKVVAYLHTYSTGTNHNYFIAVNHSDFDSTLYPNSYKKVLVCSYEDGLITFETTKIDSNSGYACDENSELLFYITQSVSGKFSYEFENSNKQKYKVCFSFNNQKATYDIQYSNTPLSNAKYVCLFKISDPGSNSQVIGDCDYVNNNYNYNYWLRVFDNMGDVRCNSDCTNNFDGRIYYACSKKLPACDSVPASCEASIKGSWNPYVEDMSQEIKCELPFNEFRSRFFTNEKIRIDSSKTDCKRTLKKKVPVKIDNQNVNMVLIGCYD